MVPPAGFSTAPSPAPVWRVRVVYRSAAGATKTIDFMLADLNQLVQVLALGPQLGEHGGRGVHLHAADGLWVEAAQTIEITRLGHSGMTVEDIAAHLELAAAGRVN